MHQHNVDFTGGDFNMSAFSTVGDVFSDPEFAAPGNSLLWGLGVLVAWTTHVVNARCSSSCPSARTNGEPMLTAATSTTTPSLASDKVTKQLTYLATTASRAVKKLNKDGLSVKPPDLSDGRDDVDERDVVYHDHVSAFLPTA